jgi:hypothetical protein
LFVSDDSVSICPFFFKTVSAKAEPPPCRRPAADEVQKYRALKEAEAEGERG